MIEFNLKAKREAVERGTQKNMSDDLANLLGEWNAHYAAYKQFYVSNGQYIVAAPGTTIILDDLVGP